MPIPELPDVPGVVIFPPLLFAVTLAFGFLLEWRWPAHPLPLILARSLGAVLLLASLALGRAGERAMHRAGTNVRPDRPTLALVTAGPFRFSRNPLYIAMLGLYLAIGLLANALWPLALVVPLVVVLRYGVIAREERYLETKFGDPYRGYLGRVRRWV